MLKQKYKLAAIAICLIFFALALFSSAGFSWRNLKYSGNGIIADEIPHIASGYYYLTTNRYFINPEHPPIVKDVAGLGEMAARPSFPDITDVTVQPGNFERYNYPFTKTDFPAFLERQNTQAYFGQMYLFHTQNNPDLIAFWARLAVIFVNTLLMFLLFWFVSKIWNPRAALVGLFFIAVSQFSIAHGSFVVIDFMSGLLSMIAVAAFGLYLKKYVERNANFWYFLVAAVTLALAELSKFSSVILFPALFLGGIVFVIAAKKSWKDFFKFIGLYAALVAVATFLIASFYMFHVYKMDNSAMVQQLWDNFPYGALPQALMGLLAPLVSLSLLTKGLVEYLNGVLMVMGRMAGSYQITYFMGHVYGSEGAGPWYFPVLYFTKLSLGFLFFNLVALILIIKKFFGDKKKVSARFRDFASNPFAMLLLTFAYLYMVETLSSTFQIGLRHIMPVIMAAAILTGRGVDIFWETKIWKKIGLKHVFMTVGTLMVASVFCSFPFYLSYYNALGGGTENGYKIATDSNYDWGGSDVRRLAKWMRDNNVHDIYTDFFADVELPYYLGDGRKSFNIEDGWMPPPGSLIAVSNYKYMNNIYNDKLRPEQKYTILEKDQIARIGPTIFVFKVSK
ncbi:MAG: glycosyltransferase family 39 protein [Candidatus Moranbacteria bacterium]|nr:glycosyltransferase family 39 protein [Candidatus Moranbacteria bacterium]